MISILAFTFLLASLPSSSKASETITYYYTDQQGTVLATANAQGDIVSQSDRRPYGEQVMGTPQDGPGYTGHVDDLSSGLIYMQARYYDPQIGHFLSTDPAPPISGDIFGFGRYGYGSNNPENRVDPTGMADECSAACMRMRRIADSMGISGALRGNVTGASGAMGQMRAVTNTLNGALETTAAEEISAASSAADAIPGATATACATGSACSVQDIALSIAAFVPIEFEAMEALQIVAINRQFTNLPAYRTAETVVSNMAYRSTAIDKAAVAIRDIAGGHLFGDGNKRTAQAVAEKMIGTQVDPSKIRSVVQAASKGELRSVEDISSALQHN